MKTLFGAGIFSLILFACNNPIPTGPTPPPPIVIEEPPRVDQPFSWDNYHGIIAFGLGHPGQSKEDVLAFISAVMSYGWNTFEICSETEFWEGPGYPTKPRDPERLQWLLDVISRVPGAQVALIGNCTLKRQIPLDEQINALRTSLPEKDIRAWHVQVADVAAHFQNIAIFTHNEFDNCRSRDDWGGNRNNCAGKQDIAEHIRIYKAAGIQYVTADDAFDPPIRGDSDTLTYTFRLANIGAFPASFHPAREKNGQPWDPSPNQLTALGRFNGDYVLSETVAFSESGNCSGLRTCNRDRIEQYITNCAAEPHCRFTYHCENCLAGEIPTWIPQAR